MSSPRITFNISGDANQANPHRLTLEQEAVATGKLSLTDLEAMVSLARSGVSSKSYIASTCPATVAEGNVVVSLRLFAWPSHRQPYTITAAIPAITTIGEPVAIEQERDFDLIIDGDSIDLPCSATDARITWQSPAILANGQVIDAPVISGYDVDQGRMVALSTAHGPINRLRLARACFGVLRVRCMAIGFSHTLTLTIPNGDTAISDLRETITAAWALADGSTDATTTDIELPACVQTLLESCEDDTRVGDHVGSKKETKTRKQLRYSTCTGAVIDYREIEVDA
jgi:hypothetical protein